MTAAGWIEIALYVAILTAITPVLGRLHGAGLPRRVGIGRRRRRRLLGDASRTGRRYARSVLVSSAVFFGLLYLILRTQGIHPWNPKTSTRAVRRLVQHDGVVRHQHELAVLRGRDDALELLADGRPGRPELRLGGRRHRRRDRLHPRARRALGQDASATSTATSSRRSSTCCCRSRSSFGLFLVSQGVIQSLSAGPVASQEVIKQLGTNGGGFFNVNSAHPFENPTWLSNFVEMLLILAIPAALTSTYGRMVGNRRQGWAIYGAMLVAVPGRAWSSSRSPRTTPTPAMDAAGIARLQHGGQGAALRRRLDRAVGRGHDRRLVRRRQRRDGVADRHRRRSSRWPRCRPARSSSAASAPASTAC